MSVEKELITYLQVLWRYKWMIAACTIIALAVAMGITFQLTPMYEGVATVRVATAPGGITDYAYLSSVTRLTNTLVEIANSDSTLDEVEQKFNLQKKPKIEAKVIPETELISITATDSDPARARDIANWLAEKMVSDSMQFNGGDTPTAREILEGQLTLAKTDLDDSVAEYNSALRCADTAKEFSTSAAPITCPNPETLARMLSVRQEIYSDLLQKYADAQTSEQLRANAVTVMGPAKLPQKPALPKKPINAALGLLAGLAMGVILAFIFEAMNDSFQSTEEVQATTTLSIIGQIPKRKETVRSFLDTIRSRKSGFLPMPAFYQLRARLLFIKARTKSTTFLLISPEPGAGKSTIAANLAVSLAEAGHQVVLADMDLHRSCVQSIFNLPDRVGLSDYLNGVIQLNEALQETQYPNLRIATAGTFSSETSVRLAPEKIGELFEGLKQNAEFVLIDAPAFLSVADPALIAPKADQVIMVVARQKTRRKQLALALQQLKELNVNIAGVVVNQVPNSRLYTYYHYGERKHRKEDALPTSPEEVRQQIES